MTDQPPADQREPYDAPDVEDLGTLADLTLGGTGAQQDTFVIGVGDVGSRG